MITDNAGREAKKEQDPVSGHSSIDASGYEPGAERAYICACLPTGRRSSPHSIPITFSPSISCIAGRMATQQHNQTSLIACVLLIACDS
jgi:hypothetical protein